MSINNKPIDHSVLEIQQNMSKLSQLGNNQKWTTHRDTGSIGHTRRRQTKQQQQQQQQK